jgi:paraquat-inducible protein A
MKETLLACHECDLLQSSGILPDGGDSRCCRCNALLRRSHPQHLERSLAFAGGALVLLVICNVFPILGLEAAGDVIETTLFGTIRSMYGDGLWLVAGLILLTTLLAPFTHLAAMLYVLIPLRFGRKPREGVRVLKLLTMAKQWGMVEVFVLGVLVSLVKLQSMATVIPGIALWSFGGLMVLFTAATAAFDTHQVWAELDGTTQ